MLGVDCVLLVSAAFVLKDFARFQCKAILPREVKREVQRVRRPSLVPKRGLGRHAEGARYQFQPHGIAPRAKPARIWACKAALIKRRSGLLSFGTMMTLGNIRGNGVRSLAITFVAGKTTEITKEETMSFSGTKSHHFITTAILVSALTLCWSAEAAHRSKSTNRYISVYISRGDPAVVICYAINKSTRKISRGVRYL